METRKMTKTQAQELVKNTKYIVFSEDESEQLQEKLFEIGCEWAFGLQKVSNTEQPFLYVDDNLMITFGKKVCFNEFVTHSNLYKQTRDILNIELDKPKFDPKTLKPFDRVLVRDENHEEWSCNLYSHLITGEYKHKYKCTNDPYAMCIPYNDDTKNLLGTKNEAPEFYKLD